MLYQISCDIINILYVVQTNKYCIRILMHSVCTYQLLSISNLGSGRCIGRRHRSCVWWQPLLLLTKLSRTRLFIWPLGIKRCSIVSYIVYAYYSL